MSDSDDEVAVQSFTRSFRLSDEDSEAVDAALDQHLGASDILGVFT